jgi:putative sigma-54 modulation protein
MQLSVTGQHLDITPALHQYVSEKIEKIVHHFDNVTNTHVVLSIEKNRHSAEVTLNAAGATLHATAMSENMYAAIDAMSDKLDRQVIKHKEKLSDHRQSDEAPSAE